MRNEKERVYDAYLAASARLGDRQALGRLAERWHPKLLAHAWRLTGDTDLAADVTQEAWMDIIKAAMAELPPDQRAALGLFYLEDLRIAEIAVALNTAPGTIKTRLMHARHKLRAQLQGD